MLFDRIWWYIVLNDAVGEVHAGHSTAGPRLIMLHLWRVVVHCDATCGEEEKTMWQADSRREAA